MIRHGTWNSKSECVIYSQSLLFLRFIEQLWSLPYRKLELQVKKRRLQMVLFVNEDLPLARVPRCVATLDKPGIIEREAVLFFFFWDGGDNEQQKRSHNHNHQKQIHWLRCFLVLVLFLIFYHSSPCRLIEYQYIVSVWKLSWSTFWGAGIRDNETLLPDVKRESLFATHAWLGVLRYSPEAAPTFPGHSQHRHYCSCRSWEVTLAIKRTQRTRSVKCRVNHQPPMSHLGFLEIV